MTQPSKAGPVILTLFALPFLGGGLLFLYAQVVSRQNFKTTDLVAGAAMASFFVLMGGGLISGSFRSAAEVVAGQRPARTHPPGFQFIWRNSVCLCAARNHPA